MNWLATWLAMCSTWRNVPAEFFQINPCLPVSQQRDRIDKLRTALRAVQKLLDDANVELMGKLDPEFTDGPEVVDALRRDALALHASLTLFDAKASDALLALESQAHRGAPMRIDAKLMLLLTLLGELERAGVRRSTAENSKMVRAVRACWGLGRLDGDPRDLLRRLERRRTQFHQRPARTRM